METYQIIINGTSAKTEKRNGHLSCNQRALGSAALLCKEPSPLIFETCITNLLKVMKTMLKVLAYLILIMCPVVNANAQDVYKPMLKEGRQWNVRKDFTDHTEFYIFQIKGKDVFAGQECYLIYYNKEGNTYGPNRFVEKDRKVFVLDAQGGSTELFDFSLGAGNSSPLITPLMINTVDTVMVCGIKYRCLLFDIWNYVGEQECWIEGIGSSSEGPFCYFNSDRVVPGSFKASVLLSVWDGDKCVFDVDEFRNATYSAEVKSTERNYGVEKRETYNLQGRCVTDIPHPGIYIRQGRKRVVR